MVGFLPCKSTGAVKFDRIFLSLASDFEGARVRLAIGASGAGPSRTTLAGPPGRSAVRELKPGDEVASIIHQQGNWSQSSSSTKASRTLEGDRRRIPGRRADQAGSATQRIGSPAPRSQDAGVDQRTADECPT